MRSVFFMFFTLEIVKIEFVDYYDALKYVAVFFLVSDCKLD